MKKLISAILSLGICITCLTACNTTVRNTIAYTIYPIGYLLKRLTGDTIPYQSIQKDDSVPVQSAEIANEYQTILNSSYVLFHIGDLEPYISSHQNAIDESGVEDGDLSAVNAVYQFERYTKTADADGNTVWLESSYYEGDIFNTIDTTDKDLFLWNDPIAMLSMAKDIKNWLVKKFPVNAELYEKNFTDLENDLINLDAQYQSFSTLLTSNHEKVAFVSVTPSFGNWQKAYSFQVYPFILSKYGVLPSEEQLAAIKARIQADGVKYIAYEDNMTEGMRALYNNVKDELGLIEVDLSNLSSLSENDTDAGKDYLSLMYENLNALQAIAVKDDTETAEDSE